MWENVGKINFLTLQGSYFVGAPDFCRMLTVKSKRRYECAIKAADLILRVKVN